MNACGLFITCHYVSLFRKKYPACRKAIVSAQTLSCLEHSEQAKPTSWHLPCSLPYDLMKFHLTEFKAFLFFPLFGRSIFCCPCMELSHSTNLPSELKRGNNAIAFHKQWFFTHKTI